MLGLVLSTISHNNVKKGFSKFLPRKFDFDTCMLNDSILKKKYYIVPKNVNQVNYSSYWTQTDIATLQ